MRKKCECRYACFHGSTYSEVVRSGDLQIESKCHMEANGHFLRIICTKCEHMRVTELCDLCWARTKQWLEHNAGCHCENCQYNGYCQRTWTLYEDAS